MDHTPASAVFATPRGRAMTVHYRANTADWNTAWSSANEDEYGLSALPDLAGWAFDIGGYLGTVGIGLALDNPGLHVLIVEPVPDNQRLIVRNVEANGLVGRVLLVKGAAGKGGETVEVWHGYRGSEAAEHHAYVGNSSLAYDHGTGEHETNTYVALSLRDLLKEAATDSVRLLKIDTEGAEWAFLQGTALRSVERIVGEWHPVRGHTQAEFAALLARTHDVTFSGPTEGPGGFTAVRR